MVGSGEVGAEGGGWILRLPYTFLREFIWRRVMVGEVRGMKEGFILCRLFSFLVAFVDSIYLRLCYQIRNFSYVLGLDALALRYGLHGNSEAVSQFYVFF